VPWQPTAGEQALFDLSNGSAVALASLMQRTLVGPTLWLIARSWRMLTVMLARDNAFALLAQALVRPPPGWPDTSGDLPRLFRAIRSWRTARSGMG
jgi:hypothetical protein